MGRRCLKEKKENARSLDRPVGCICPNSEEAFALFRESSVSDIYQYGSKPGTGLLFVKWGDGEVMMYSKEISYSIKAADLYESHVISEDTLT